MAKFMYIIALSMLIMLISTLSFLVIVFICGLVFLNISLVIYSFIAIIQFSVGTAAFTMFTKITADIIKKEEERKKTIEDEAEQ